MGNSYPNPCDTCPECTSTNGCERWRIRYRYRQKQINAFARHLVEKNSMPEEKASWVYLHPDEVRRYLDTNPCDACMCREWCEDICKVRADWWEAKMVVLRRRLT